MMTQKDVIEHLKIVHSLTDMKGSRQMVMHLDGRGWYQSSYRCEIGGVVLMNYVQYLRNRNDSMRY